MGWLGYIQGQIRSTHHLISGLGKPMTLAWKIPGWCSKTLSSWGFLVTLGFLLSAGEGKGKMREITKRGRITMVMKIGGRDENGEKDRRKRREITNRGRIAVIKMEKREMRDHKDRKDDNGDKDRRKR